MENLNNLNTFNQGFKIKRGDEVITLTIEEMIEFNRFNNILDGRKAIEEYEKKYDLDLSEEKDDEDICWKIINLYKDTCNKSININDIINEVLKND